MKQINRLLLVLFSLSFFACDDDDDDVVVDATPPTVLISSPAAGATFTRSDVIELRAEVRDNVGLAEVRVYITDPNITVRQLSKEGINDFLNDDREKDLDLEITLDATAPTGPYVMTVEAIDEQGNAASHYVSVFVTE
ncbi:DUF4625 domain-containing protein [Pontibacter diazotrophicus]|nr:DUF4625 domain-containing protein [Pontibacter diazotrophicus]